MPSIQTHFLVCRACQLATPSGCQNERRETRLQNFDRAAPSPPVQKPSPPGLRSETPLKPRSPKAFQNREGRSEAELAARKPAPAGQAERLPPPETQVPAPRTWERRRAGEERPLVLSGIQAILGSAARGSPAAELRIRFRSPPFPRRIDCAGGALSWTAAARPGGSSEHSRAGPGHLPAAAEGKASSRGPYGGIRAARRALWGRRFPAHRSETVIDQF